MNTLKNYIFTLICTLSLGSIGLQAAEQTPFQKALALARQFEGGGMYGAPKIEAPKKAAVKPTPKPAPKKPAPKPKPKPDAERKKDAETKRRAAEQKKQQMKADAALAKRLEQEEKDAALAAQLHEQEQKMAHEPAPATPKAAPASEQHIAKQILKFTNEYRATKKLPALAWDQGMANVSCAYSKVMGTKNPAKLFLTHDGFDSRNSFRQRIVTLPTQPRSCAENLYGCFGVDTIARSAVDGWIKSPGHHENLIGNYTHCGIGLYQTPHGIWYVTQIFGNYTA